MMRDVDINRSPFIYQPYGHPAVPPIHPAPDIPLLTYLPTSLRETPLYSFPRLSATPSHPSILSAPPPLRPPRPSILSACKSPSNPLPLPRIFLSLPFPSLPVLSCPVLSFPPFPEQSLPVPKCQLMRCRALPNRVSIPMAKKYRACGKSHREKSGSVGSD